MTGLIGLDEVIDDIFFKLDTAVEDLYVNSKLFCDGKNFMGVCRMDALTVIGKRVFISGNKMNSDDIVPVFL